MNFLVVFLFLWGAGIVAQASERKLPTRPNIIFIYADDLGMGMLGCYGQEIVKTPHIDRLANQGMMFTRAYSSQYCCPARASLLMGVHDSHARSYTQTPGGLVMEMDREGGSMEEFVKKAEAAVSVKPSPGEVFLPQLLRKAGYVTGQFGKLDWGFTAYPAEVERHGWDRYVGYMDHERAHGFYPLYLWKDGKKLLLEGNTRVDAGVTKENYSPGSTERRRQDREGKRTYAPDVLLKETLLFMEENRDKPLFVFFSTNLPHGPVDIPPSENVYSGNGAIQKGYGDARGGNAECASAAEEYASMVHKLDRQVGAIVDKVRELGLEKKTVIIFASDNGHELYYRTDKGRGRSLDYHGGVDDRTGEVVDVFRGSRGRFAKGRPPVNMAGLKWTNHEGGIHVPLIVCWPGRVSAGRVSSELVANYDHMATFAELAGADMPEGKDALSYKEDLLGMPRKKKHDYVVIDKTIITRDGWKLTKKKDWLLFDLKRDPEERRNLAVSSPEPLARLRAIYDREVGSPRRDK